jgi:hypothetical protein
LSSLRRQLNNKDIYFLNDLKEELDQADRYSFMEPLILAESGQQINNQSLVEMGQSYSIEGNLLK